MPRANRHFIPGHVWHITHRCHEKDFLLKFSKDRCCWVSWLYEAKKRYGLCVLNYIVTSNHIHLLVQDTGHQAIPKSMQLLAGRTAQQYNQRKQRRGAFWEDRYHATAIETDEHLHRCLVYIDLNMVRAGVVKHPSQWKHSGYQEIHTPPQRKAIVDLQKLMKLCCFNDLSAFQLSHKNWVEETLKEDKLKRVAMWSESIAVGSKAFVENTQNALGILAKGRHCETDGDSFHLKEERVLYHFYPEKGQLNLENGLFWDDKQLESLGPTLGPQMDNLGLAL
ncbi:MAG: transposase [Gammaproteobacteria bacterium]|nr:transposase [Gammaproteobacteria bacterium]